MKKLLTHSQHYPDAEFIFDCLYDDSCKPDAIASLSQHEWQYDQCLSSQGDFYKLSEYAVRNQIPFWVVTGTHCKDIPLHDCDDPVYANTYVLSYPVHWLVNTWWLFQKNNPEKSKFTDLSDPANIQWLFITLNNKPFPHRCMFMDFLAEHEILEKGMFSWDTFQELDGRKPDPSPDSIYYYSWKHWTPVKTMIDDVPEWCTGGNNYGWNGELPDCYRNCFFQIVGESTTRVTFFTEKVVPPLMTGKPFLVSGSPGYHSNLQDLGFELYDEIFDYSFDQITDTQSRVRAMMNNILKYASYSPEQLAELYAKIHVKLLHNSEHIKHIAHNADLYVPDPIKEYCASHNPGIVNNEIFHHWKQSVSKSGE